MYLIYMLICLYAYMLKVKWIGAQSMYYETNM
jgi:hypothetical protein